MISHIMEVVRRNAGPPANISHTMLNLLAVLLILILFALVLVAALLFMRHRRRARMQDLLPMYEEKRLSTSSTSSHHRRVMVRPSESVYVYQEKQSLAEDDTPPASPVPEIRITFPEEVDASGKRQSGRVVVVRVGDSGIGLEPVVEKLPAYEASGERFQSLDLERIGGLVEKTRAAPHAWQ